MSAKIVIGLGFGDEGKGITTDYLCSRSSQPIVVRFSGGQQAGHTVMVNNMKHVCSNYGAGVLRGIPSYFSEHTSFYLNTMENEKLELNKLGITPTLILHPLAKMTTPYDVAYNRLTEKINGHGSVGLGIAATMKRHHDTGYKLQAVDYMSYGILSAKLEQIKNFYHRKVTAEGLDVQEFINLYKDPEEYFYSICRDLERFIISDYDVLMEYEDIVFEGSQGIMLDMTHGVFPNVTWGNTTSKNAIEICKKLEIEDESEVFYITRCYQTRHGNGWMSNVPGNLGLINNEEEINTTNQWQGNFKTAEIDYHLINQALLVDGIYSKNIDKNLVVTCLDQRPNFEFDYNMINCEFSKYFQSKSPKTNLYEITPKGKLTPSDTCNS